MNIEISTERIEPDVLSRVCGDGTFSIYVPHALAEAANGALEDLGRLTDALIYTGAIFETLSPETSWMVQTEEKIFISTGTL